MTGATSHVQIHPPTGVPGTGELSRADADTLLAAGGYGLRIQVTGAGYRLAGAGAGRGLPLPRPLTGAALYRALVRLGRTRQINDPGWLHDVAVRLAAGADPARPLARGLAQELLLRRLRFNTMVEDDPVLRLYCATRPVRATLGDPRAGLIGLVRAVNQHPPHPAHPGGTLPASLEALVANRGALLSLVITSRPEHRLDPRRYFLDRFVRPPVKVFRTVLDRYELSLRDDFTFELSPEFTATGRIVVRDFACLPDDPDQRRSTVHTGLLAVLRAVEALTDAFQPGAGLRAEVERVIAEELRFLRPETAALLGRAHPIGDLVHAVPATQEETLRAILRRVEDGARRRRADPSAPRPAVMIDLDLCGLVPRERTLRAAGQLASPRPGAPDGITELSRPAQLALLPAYQEQAWRNFVHHNELGARYPDVDWPALRAEYEPAFHRPWEHQRTDTLTPGLARFVWDVRDAGGEVVFNTGRRERLRGYTEEALARGGILAPRLLMMPNDRERPVHELKVENLRRIADLDVVAVLDDLAENRIALAAAYPGAMTVAVEVPGFAAERPPGGSTVDGAQVIATFEHRPMVHASPEPALSHARSIEELQLGEVSVDRIGSGHAVRLSHGESLALIDQLVTQADASADRTARNAHRQLQDALSDSGPDRIGALVHHVLTRKQFNKGSRANYTAGQATRDIAPYVRAGAPIPITLLGFPIKQAQSGLKAFGLLPDLAELAGLVRLRELHRAVRGVYPPGLRILLLTDGQHFRRRPAAATDAYQRKVAEYVRLVGLDGVLTRRDIDDVATERFGADLPARRAAVITRQHAVLTEALHGLDVTRDPLSTLAEARRRIGGAGGPVPRFDELFMSIAHSVGVDVPAGHDRLVWSREVYRELYHLTDPAAPEVVLASRRQVLTAAWRGTLRYLCAAEADHALGYDRLTEGIRLKAGASAPGSPGFSYLGGSALLPWHGTGAVDLRGIVAVDFAVSLVDQGFVPVFSPLLSPVQPWMMVPVTATRVLLRNRGAELDPEYLATIRLRAK